MFNTTIKLPLEMRSSKRNQCTCVLILVTDRSNDQSKIYYSTKALHFKLASFGGTFMSSHPNQGGKNKRKGWECGRE